MGIVQGVVMESGREISSESSKLTDLTVPNTKKPTKLAVTPGINKQISIIEFPTVKLGPPEAAMDALLLD